MFDMSWQAQECPVCPKSVPLLTVFYWAERSRKLSEEFPVFASNCASKSCQLTPSLLYGTLNRTLVREVLWCQIGWGWKNVAGNGPDQGSREDIWIQYHFSVMLPVSWLFENCIEAKDLGLTASCAMSRWRHGGQWLIKKFAIIAGPLSAVSVWPHITWLQIQKLTADLELELAQFFHLPWIFGHDSSSNTAFAWSSYL